MTKDEALGIAVDYVHAALISHDNAYGNHPAMKRERDEIVRDLEALRQALAEPLNDQDYIKRLEDDFRRQLDELSQRNYELRHPPKPLAEPPNASTDVVEPETEEPLTLEEQREAQQQLENHLDAVYQRNDQAFLAQAQLGQPDATKWLDEIRGDEPDTGIDRGAWSDVPNATKWVDELRGDEPSTDVEPIGEIVEAHGLIAVSIPEMPPVGTKLYAQPLLNQTCCGCGRSGGYALYCGWCWSKFNKS